MYKCQRQFQGFEEGRLDVLLEVKLLQAYGLWTKAKRTRWIKKAVAEQLCLKHRMLPQASTYFAGRVAGLKSALTAQYPEPCPEIFALTVFLPVMESCLPACKLSDCGHVALWECYLGDDPDRMMILCDCCREKLLEAEAAYRNASRGKLKIQLFQLADMREELLEVFRRPAPSSPLGWLEELADTPILIGDPEGIHSTSVGEIAGTLVRQPVVWAMVYWSWRLLPPIGIALVLPMLMALLLSLLQRKEDIHEYGSIFL